MGLLRGHRCLKPSTFNHTKRNAEKSSSSMDLIKFLAQGSGWVSVCLFFLLFFSISIWRKGLLHCSTLMSPDSNFCSLFRLTVHGRHKPWALHPFLSGLQDRAERRLCAPCWFLSVSVVFADQLKAPMCLTCALSFTLTDTNTEITACSSNSYLFCVQGLTLLDYNNRLQCLPVDEVWSHFV